MGMIDKAFRSLKANAAKSRDAKARKDGNSGKGRNRGTQTKTRHKTSRRNPQASERNFRLSPVAVNELQAAGGTAFINPYRPTSTYHACIAALQKLGVGKLHSFDNIEAAVITAMASETLKSFKIKKKRNKKTGKSWKERIVQNVRVLARSDYGAKLRQVGHEVRTNREKGAGLFKVSNK
jgi:hypothetical protein